MPAVQLGTLVFGEVQGIITPATVPDVEPVENPAALSSTLSLPGTNRVDSLTYRGFFATGQKAALFALVDTIIAAEDETGAVETVKVKRVLPRQRKAKAGGVMGFWVEASVDVIAWVAPP
jgi:hypothetical protein